MKQDASENKDVKHFVQEAIGALVESIGNRQEQESILNTQLKKIGSDGSARGAAALGGKALSSLSFPEDLDE